jgi:hypothetical protein
MSQNSSNTAPKELQILSRLLEMQFQKLDNQKFYEQNLTGENLKTALKINDGLSAIKVGSFLSAFHTDIGMDNTQLSVDRASLRKTMNELVSANVLTSQQANADLYQPETRVTLGAKLDSIISSIEAPKPDLKYREGTHDNQINILNGLTNLQYLAEPPKQFNKNTDALFKSLDARKATNTEDVPFNSERNTTYTATEQQQRNTASKKVDTFIGKFAESFLDGLATPTNYNTQLNQVVQLIKDAGKEQVFHKALVGILVEKEKTRPEDKTVLTDKIITSGVMTREQIQAQAQGQNIEDTPKNNIPANNTEQQQSQSLQTASNLEIDITQPPKLNEPDSMQKPRTEQDQLPSQTASSLAEQTLLEQQEKQQNQESIKTTQAIDALKALIEKQTGHISFGTGATKAITNAFNNETTFNIIKEEISTILNNNYGMDSIKDRYDPSSIQDIVNNYEKSKPTQSNGRRSLQDRNEIKLLDEFIKAFDIKLNQLEEQAEIEKEVGQKEDSPNQSSPQNNQEPKEQQQPKTLLEALQNLPNVIDLKGDVIGTIESTVKPFVTNLEAERLTENLRIIIKSLRGGIAGETRISEAVTGMLKDLTERNVEILTDVYMPDQVQTIPSNIIEKYNKQPVISRNIEEVDIQEDLRNKNNIPSEIIEGYNKQPVISRNIEEFDIQEGVRNKTNDLNASFREYDLEGLFARTNKNRGTEEQSTDNILESVGTIDMIEIPEIPQTSTLQRKWENALNDVLDIQERQAPLSHLGSATLEEDEEVNGNMEKIDKFTKILARVNFGIKDNDSSSLKQIFEKFGIESKPVQDSIKANYDKDDIPLLKPLRGNIRNIFTGALRGVVQIENYGGPIEYSGNKDIDMKYTVADNLSKINLFTEVLAKFNVGKKEDRQIPLEQIFKEFEIERGDLKDCIKSEYESAKNAVEAKYALDQEAVKQGRKKQEHINPSDQDGCNKQGINSVEPKQYQPSQKGAPAAPKPEELSVKHIASQAQKQQGSQNVQEQNSQQQQVEQANLQQQSIQKGGAAVTTPEVEKLTVSQAQQQVKQGAAEKKVEVSQPKKSFGSKIVAAFNNLAGTIVRSKVQNSFKRDTSGLIAQGLPSSILKQLHKNDKAPNTNINQLKKQQTGQSNGL